MIHMYAAFMLLQHLLVGTLTHVNVTLDCLLDYSNEGRALSNSSVNKATLNTA